MPYIQPDKRSPIDNVVDAHTQTIESMECGELNYFITRIVAVWASSRFSYSGICQITGVLENVKQEFYRRFAEPLEEQKRRANGDIVEYDRAKTRYPRHG